MVSRRAFMGGTAVAATAAALGIRPDKTVRTKLGMYFFGPEPIIFDVCLCVDKCSDLLVMEVRHNKDHVIAHLPLEAVKRAVAAPGEAQCADVRIWKDGILGKRAEESGIKIIAQKSLLTLRGPGDEAAPAWLPLEDVERVL